MFLSKKLKAPYIKEKYRLIYAPEPAVYHGPDTPSFRQGENYTEWVVSCA